MISCRASCGGEIACKLGHLTKYPEIYGCKLSLAPTGGAVPDLKHHPIMIIAKSPDMFDTQSIGNGRNVERLKDLLSLATVSTDDVYVTGLVKCCPPRRNPSVQEIKACMGHLADELRIVDPEVVVLMGSDCLRAFNLMGEGGVTTLHGQVLKRTFPHDETLVKEYNVVVMPDPNSLYMNPDPKLEGSMIKDLRVAKSVVEGTLKMDPSTPTNYKIINSIADLSWMIAKIQEKGVFAFDTESRGLPWSTSPMICMSFCWGYGTDDISAAVLPFYNHDPDGTDWKLKNTWSKQHRALIIQYLKVIFEDNNIPKIAHNIKYDMCVLRKHVGLEVKGFLFDTMLMHHVLWEYPPHDLEYLADLELGTGDYSKELHKITGHGKVLKNTYDHVPDLILYPYAAKDAECTYRLMLLYYSRLKAKLHLWTLYQEEVHPFIRTLFKAEWYGAKLDAGVIDTLTNEFEKELEELLISLKEATWPEFNPSSSADVAEAINKAGYWKDIEDPKKTKGYCTDKQTLLKLAIKLPLVENIMRYRSLTKLTGTYMCNAKELANLDSRARISVMIHGTVNGRVSCSFLHQIPRLDKKRIENGLGNLRDMFIARPGYKLVYGDFSQIELVILAIMSKDKEMLKVFTSGEDIHKATAAAFLELCLPAVTEHNRSIGKSINFGRVYGSVDGYALMKLSYRDNEGKEKPVTEQMVKRGFASLDAKFPGASRYFSDTVLEISANDGLLITPFGREKHLGTTLSQGNGSARRNAERQAVNGSIQSPANSVTVRCLNAVDAALVEKIQNGEITEEEALLIITVHDSGLWEVKDEHVGWFESMLREIASRPVPQLDNYKFTMKVGVGNSWSEAELNAR